MSEEQTPTNKTRTLQRKRKALVFQHARMNPRDVFFENLSLPENLSLQPIHTKACERNPVDDANKSHVNAVDMEVDATGPVQTSFPESSQEYDRKNIISDDCIDSGDDDASKYNIAGTSSRKDQVGTHTVDRNSCNVSGNDDGDDDDDEDYDNDDDDEHGYDDDDRNDDDNDDDYDDDADGDEDGSDDSDDDGANPFRQNARARWSEEVTMKPGITKLDIVSGILAIADRSNLTYAAVMQIMKFMQSILMNSSIPRTMKSVLKLIGMDKNDPLIRHYYCSVCLDVMGNDRKKIRNTCQCPGKKSLLSKKTVPYFIQFPIGQQFRRLIQNPTFSKDLQYPRTRQKKSTNVHDMFDGEEYKKLLKPGQFLSDPNNFSLTFNTDGCSVSNSSNTSAWPILFQVNELPPHVRKRAILLAGIWVDKKHPDLSSFLLPTMIELQDLYINGVEWTNPENGRKTISKLITTVCCVDTPARADVLNMKRFNGKFGCTFCKLEGETASNKNVHIYPIIDNPSNLLRTDSEMRRIMNTCHNNADQVELFGIKGPSAMLLVPKFNLNTSVVVESMHAVYLGVTKFHTMLIFDASITNVRMNKMTVVRIKKVVNSELLKIRRPSRIARNTRSLDELNNWKANEWRNWLLYYGLICLRGVVVEEQLELFAMLSEAIYIYNKDSITVGEMKRAQYLIDKYIQGFQDFFGRDKMRFNVHLLSHLPDTVKNWGPLWSHSAFVFESFNKKVIDRVTSANSRPLQIATRQIMGSFVENLLYDPLVTIDTKARILKIQNDGKKKGRRRHYGLGNLNASNTLTFDEKGASLREPEPWELEALQAAGVENTRMLMSYKKATFGGLQYERSNTSAKITRHCDEYIYSDNFEFCKILDIVQLENDTKRGFFVQLLFCVGNVSEAQHINVVELSNEKKFLHILDDIPKPAIVMGSNLTYAVALSNIWESD